jgi:HlyD family secretion protein
MKRSKGKKWIVILCAAALVIAAAAFFTLNAGVAAEIVATERGEVVKLLKETGTVESASSIVVTAKNAGEVKGLALAEGDSVRAGELLMADDSGTSAALDIKSQQAQLSGLQAQYGQARDLADKNRSLYDQGALSYEEYNAADTAARQLAAQIASLQYAMQSYAESAGTGGVKAPVSGVLTGVFVKEGEQVLPGAPLFEISDLEDIHVRADFIAEDADQIREGDAARIYNQAAGFDDVRATVKKIHLKAENKMSDLGVNQKRVTVEISLSAASALRLGSDMDVEITVEKKTDVLRVSDLAVFEKDRKDWVYAVESGKAVLREIKIGLEGEDYVEILSGLSQGDLIILSPGDDLSPGVRVKAQE